LFIALKTSYYLQFVVA